MSYSIGVDIGGTKINFALLNNWQKEKIKKVLTPQTKEEIVVVIEKNIRILTEGISDSEIIGIGIGVPSLLDSKKEIILAPPNLEDLDNFPLAKFIKRDLGIETKLENDSNCFALAESIMGAAKGCSIVLGITIGTGIGGGIVFKKGDKCEIYEGAFGRAGEIGHTVFDYRGFDCSCGKKDVLRFMLLKNSSREKLLFLQ
jgi:glucokinase